MGHAQRSPNPLSRFARLCAPAGALVALLLVSGCSSVGGSAIRTGAVRMPAYSGDVAIYSAQPAPGGAVDLGIVEVHAAQNEATVGLLLPEFVRKVAQIGGNVAVIEGVRARFDLVARNQVETFYYTCGLSYTCAGTRVYTVQDEIMVVSMFGRAMTTRAGAAVPQGPLLPPEALVPEGQSSSSLLPPAAPAAPPPQPPQTPRPAERSEGPLLPPSSAPAPAPVPAPAPGERQL